MRTRMILSLLFICFTAASLAAQEVVTDTIGWKKTLLFDITTTQTAYSDSWVGGEAGAFSWVSNLNGTAERQFTPKFNYSTILKLSFGQTMIQDEETKDWSRPKKSTDLIDWDNLGRFTFGGFVDPYAAFRLESQFYTLHQGPTDREKVLFRPFRLTESAGIARRFWEKPEADHITSRFGLAVRQVWFSDLIDSAAFIIEKDMFTDGGLESVTDAVITFNPQLAYTGKLTIFKALFFSEKDKVEGTPAEDDWKAVDVNWENTINARLTRLVTVVFYTQVLYDKQVSKKGRFKETLGLGLSYKIW